MSSVDFNLLRALQALLEERSVTRAAERLNLSQPAASGALAKLRRHYQDELLIRVGNAYQLTPLAAQLLDHAASAVAVADRIFSLQADFDPETSQRTFAVGLSDYTTTVIGGSLSRLLAERAPHVQVHLQQLTAEIADKAPESLSSIDAIVLPHSVLSDLPYQDLLRDEWVCVVSADNPSVGDELTRDHLTELPWVFTFRRSTAFTTAARELRIHGIEPRVQMVTEGYTVVPALVAGTNRIALIQKRLTRLLPGMGSVRVLPCPVPLAPLVLALWWHPAHTVDSGHQWLRRLLAEAAQSVT